ncbi:RHS repeat-associated core domain-containing protein [Isoptericola cucumis]|uniref:RHS repeat-associated protein n=3 Tax=Isoptericola cucumis TaxID=1776856 RepID=A0ABQ2BB00_9MICO|nr:RHS repeat-associated core domain-containing protein [Isoptericola cucumis]GGI12206.1 hypothetical protein GCM10007368_40010 [Isoptericola cucumis]
MTKTLNWDASAYVASSVIYDGLLRPRQTQSPSASASAAGRVITDTMYDARGLATVVRDGWATTGSAGASLVVSSGAVDSRILTQYDGAGRAGKETFQVGAGEKPDDDTSYLPKWSTTTTYEGDRVHVDPPSGGVPTTTVSDARGNTTELWQYTGAGPAGTHHVTSYRYDDAERLVGVSDPKGNTWTYDYDLRGRQIATSDPDKGDATSTYDAVGNVVTATDARGETLAYTYDALGRQTTLRDDTVTGTVRARWAFDTEAKGHLTSSTRIDGADQYTTTFGGYTDQYLPTSQTVTLPESLGNAAGSYTYEYVYTKDGRVWGQSIPAAGGLGEERMSVYYSPVAGTNAATGLTGGADWGNYVTEADYLPTGEVSYLDLGTTYAYQQAMYYQTGTRRLTGATTTQETGNQDDQLHELQHLSYSYDDAGNLLSAKDAPELGGQPKDQQCFDYDWAQRLTQAWTPASGDCAVAPSVAGLGGGAPYWKSYSYDVLGNRTSAVLHRSAAVGGDVTSTYARPVSGESSMRPHAVSSVTAKTPTATLGTSSFAYDAAGNTSRRAVAGEAVQTLSWDAEGELAGVSADQDGDGAVEALESDEYVYSASGERLVRRAGGTTTVYLPGQELTIGSAGNVSATRYYSFAGKTVAVRTGSWFDDVSAIVSDPHNTGVLQVKNVSNTVTRRHLDPFGAERTSAAGAPDGSTGTAGWVGDHGFLDKPADDTGLSQVGARYYDPVLGSFISVDPVMDLADPQQWNAYAYANNRPTTLSDPTGMLPPGSSGNVGYNPRDENDSRRNDPCIGSTSCIKTKTDANGRSSQTRECYTEHACNYYATHDDAYESATGKTVPVVNEYNGAAAGHAAAAAAGEQKRAREAQAKEDQQKSLVARVWDWTADASEWLTESSGASWIRTACAFAWGAIASGCSLVMAGAYARQEKWGEFGLELASAATGGAAGKAVKVAGALAKPRLIERAAAQGRTIYRSERRKYDKTVNVGAYLSDRLVAGETNGSW